MSAMAELRIIRNVLRCWTASDSSGEEFVIIRGRTGVTALLDNSCSILLLKVVGRILVLCVCDGNFMVSMKALQCGRFAQWFEKVVDDNL
jgi:hypothetical protein